MPKIYDDYPQSATNNAKRALKWLKENDNPNKCLTATGWRRARQLANREKLDRETVARMASFKRHQKNKDVPYEDGCGGIAWDCWGGTSGINWAIKKIKQIDKKNYQMKKENKKENIEVRNFEASELRIENAESREVVGYGSVFNSLSENLGGFRERIDERAFDDVLENDVRALFNHDSNYILGRTTANTLKLSVDERGLRYSVNIPETTYGNDLMVSLDRGDITQNSFGFIVEEDDWSQDEEGNTIRTIKKVSRLLDVSLVTYPAYPEATIAQRGFLNYTTELEKKENTKEEKVFTKRNLLDKKIELLKLKNQD